VRRRPRWRERRYTSSRSACTSASHCAGVPTLMRKMIVAK